MMEISLGGGAPGPDSGGLTQMGGRADSGGRAARTVKPVETPAGTDAAEDDAAGAESWSPSARSRKTPEATAPRRRQPATQVREGSAPVETRARGTGFGLSSAGGSGGDLKLDVTDFCCNEYLQQMMDFIQTNWRNQQGRSGSTVVRFTIHRNGMIEADRRGAIERVSDSWTWRPSERSS